MKNKQQLRLASLIEEGFQDKAVKLAADMLDGIHTTKEELIGHLNKDIEFEYSAVIQYVQHANLLSGAPYGEIRKELLKHADEELEHAKKLSDRVVYMGGIPSVQAEKVLTAPDSLNMLRLDVAAERNAIDRYNDRIVQAISLKEFGLVTLLQEILLEEEEHENDVLMALGSYAELDPGNDSELGADLIDNAPEPEEQPDVDRYTPVMAAEARKERATRLAKLKTK